MHNNDIQYNKSLYNFTFMLSKFRDE